MMSGERKQVSTLLSPSETSSGIVRGIFSVDVSTLLSPSETGMVG